MSGKKDDSEKPKVDYIPVEFTIGTAKALTFGGNKYGAHNFRKGINYTRLLAAAKRHIDLELANIENDRDSNLEHWTHAAASLAMYAFMKYHRKDFDDRFQYTEEEKKTLEELMYGEKNVSSKE